MKHIKQDGISILELCVPPPSKMKFQIWFTIWVRLEKQFGAIVSWVLNLLDETTDALVGTEILFQSWVDFVVVDAQNSGREGFATRQKVQQGGLPRAANTHDCEQTWRT